MPLGRGEVKGVDALIGLLRSLPLDVHATRGVGWVADLCIQSGRVTVSRSWLLNTWLKETRNDAEELGRLGEWQMLVDALVVAVNERVGCLQPVMDRDACGPHLRVGGA